jgi:hypothetical protein
VVEEPRLFLSENHHPAGPVGEPFEHWAAPPFLSGRRTVLFRKRADE